MTPFLRSFLTLLLLWQASAFQTTAPTTRQATRFTTNIHPAASSEEEVTPVTVESVLKDKYPEFHSLLSKNDNIFEHLENDYLDGYTLLAPNSAAFDALTEKQLAQVNDPRNLETAQKMGLYHVIGERLSLTDLNREDWTVPKTPEGLPALKFGALLTLGGEVPIGRTKKKMDGNFFQQLIGQSGEVELDENGKPKTVIIVGPTAKILRTAKVGKSLIHEVDSLVSPLVLWRYFDQLRIPGF